MSNSNRKGNRWRITLQKTDNGSPCQQPISRSCTGSQKAYQHAGHPTDRIWMEQQGSDLVMYFNYGEAYDDNE